MNDAINVSNSIAVLQAIASREGNKNDEKEKREVYTLMPTGGGLQS